MACVSCKFSSMKRSATSTEGKKNMERDRNRNKSGCDLSHCTLRTAPVEYKVNEKNYYPEMHGAWRYHCRNRKFVGKYPFSKTNYLRVGPGEELIWGRDSWYLIDYYKRCCGNKTCKPLQWRGYTAWLKPQRAQDDPYFTTGPQGGLVVSGGDGPVVDGCGRKDFPCGGGACRCGIISTLEDPKKKRFRFLSCGPLKPGWGCSGLLSCHTDDGFCPKEPPSCECRGVFKGEVGCRECEGKIGDPSCCRKFCCGRDQFRPFKPFGEQEGPFGKQRKGCGSGCPCPCYCPPEEYDCGPRINFGRKTLFRPLEKVPPMNLDLLPYIDPCKYKGLKCVKDKDNEEQEQVQSQRNEGNTNEEMEENA